MNHRSIRIVSRGRVVILGGLIALACSACGQVALVSISGCHWSYPTSAFSVVEGTLVGYDQ